MLGGKRFVQKPSARVWRVLCVSIRSTEHRAALTLIVAERRIRVNRIRYRLDWHTDENDGNAIDWVGWVWMYSGGPRR